MEHLRQTFFDSLAEESSAFVRNGRIYIREHHWAPDDVLKNMLEPGSVEDVFKRWLAERAEAMISLADEILKDNHREDRFRALIEAHRHGVVFPFVGAGMSQPSGYPGWTNFLHQIRQDSDMTEAELGGLIQRGEYEEAAQRLAISMGPGFNEAVQNAFGCARPLSGPILLVPYVFKGAVFTTNFDDVIKKCARLADHPVDYEYTLREGKELARLLAAGGRILVRLHGRAVTDSDRILTRSEYDRHYEDGDAKVAVETLFGRTLLFMGCQLTIDRTLGVMRELVAAKGHDAVPRHYAFMCLPDTAEEKAARRDQLLECNIYPIWFPKDTHNESIEAFLYKMMWEGEQ